MKMSKMFLMLGLGMFLSFSLAACAGSDTMGHENTMNDHKADQMKTDKNDMTMQDDGMKGGAMEDQSQSDSMMKSDDMTHTDTMQGETMDQMKPGDDGMKGDTMQDESHSDSMMKTDGM